MRIEISNLSQIINPQSAIDSAEPLGRDLKFYPMRIDCHKCIHYYVTWNPKFPHGCAGMGFKSRRYPIDEVRHIMNGKDCLLFTARKEKKIQPSKNLNA